MGVFLVNLNFALYDLLDNSLGSTQCSGFEFCLLSSFFLKKGLFKEIKSQQGIMLWAFITVPPPKASG